MSNTEDDDSAARILDHLKTLRRLLREHRAATGTPFRFPGKLAPELRQPEFEGARVFSNRQHLVTALISGGTGAEIGVEFGHFSRVLLEKLNPRALHLFELNFARVHADVTSDPRVTCWEGDSSSNLAQLPDAHFDWIYIDGDHSYQGCLKDAETAERKLKPGGVAVFNDYTNWSPPDAARLGVMPVVNELINSGRWKLRGIALAWHGFHDVALERI